MAEAKVRLSRLIDLARETSPEKQRALAFELCELLTDWPSRYPLAMREPFEALLEKVLRRVDGTSRRMIAQKLAAHAETSLVLLNAFYFDVPPEARAPILARNSGAEGPPFQPVAGDEEVRVVDAARRTRGHEFAVLFGDFLRISRNTAERILGDASGNALAVACKGAGVRRATYSTLALLVIHEPKPNSRIRMQHLAEFDEVPLDGARRLVAHWRLQFKEELRNARGVHAA